MTKKIIIYILFAACFLSACRSDYFEPVEPVADATNDELTLTVSTSEIVVSDGVASRADDQGPSTVFKGVDDDCVGLIVLDKDGQILVNNVPYKYNGDKWLFDADNSEGKERVYYDATMWKYIVYYPYHPSVDGAGDVDDLMILPVFKPRVDQNKERDYRFSDLMVWTSEGEAIRDLPVELKHVRNSLSLDVKLKWELGLPSDLPNDSNFLEYHPLREALIDFRVRLNDEEILNDDYDYTFHAEDGTQRYILPEDFTMGKITWRYTYRGESYGGESKVSTAGGVRYVHHTTADISHDKAEIYDYYSYKKINGENYGFVMPWDAAECFETYNPIGIVFYVGNHSNDGSDYTDTGIGQKECHGYVVALADAFLTDAADPNKSFQLKWANPDADNNIPNVTGNTDNNDWSGYEDLIKIRNFPNQSDIVDGSIFPAEYACETYVGSDGIKGAPLNTSGWFLPTSNMLKYITNDSKFNEAFKTVVKYADTTIENPSPDKPLFESSTEGYWSSTENEVSDKETHEELKLDKDGNPIQAKDKDGNLLWEDKDKKKPKYETVVITDYEWHYAYFMIIDNKMPKISAISKATAKFVRPVLAF